MIQFTDFYDDIGFMAALFYTDMLNNADIYEIANHLTNKAPDDNLATIIANGTDDDKNKKLFKIYLNKLKIKLLNPKKALIAKVFYYILHNRIDLDKGIRFAAFEVSNDENITKYVGDDVGIEQIVGDYYAIDDGNITDKEDIEATKKLIVEGMQQYVHDNEVIQEQKQTKQHHGFVTFWLWLMLVLNILAIGFYIPQSDYAIWIYSTEENAQIFFYFAHTIADLYRYGMFALGILSIGNIFAMALLLKLKKSAFWLFFSMNITAIVIMVIFTVLGGLSSAVLLTITGNLLGTTILWILLYKFENILNTIKKRAEKKAIKNLSRNDVEIKKKKNIRREKIGKVLLFVGGIILLFLGGRLIYKNIEFAKMIPDTKDGVVINGVIWATSNIGASSPKRRGNTYNFYQAQDACPTGWRVPTREELQSLLEIEKVSNSEWKAPNGVEGRIFTDKITGNSIFLPDTKDSGIRGGQYWSSTKDTTANVRGYEFAYHLHLWGNPGVFTGNAESFLFSLRCVKD